MAARSLAVLVIALAATLGPVTVAGAVRNGPIAWEQLQRAGPATVESDSAGGEIRDLLGPALLRAGPGVFSPTGDRYAYNGIGRGGISRVFVAHLHGSRAGTQEELLTQRGRPGSGSATGHRTLRASSTTTRRTSGAPTSRPSTTWR